VDLCPEALKPSLHRRHLCGSWIADRMMVEVRNLQDTLSKLLSEATAAADDAIARNSARKQFVRSLFHDVRVPLSAMRMAIDQMSPEQRESDLMTIVTEQCDAATRLLNNVLTLDKMETGDLSLVVEPFRMAECVTKALRIFAPIAAAKGISLTASIRSIGTDARTVLTAPELLSNTTQSTSLNDDPEVLGDCTRISQIISNLLSNGMESCIMTMLAHTLTLHNRSSACIGLFAAFKFTAEGSISLELDYDSSRCQADCTHAQCDAVGPAMTTESAHVLDVRALRRGVRELWCRVTVRDTGVGMTQDEQDRLFKPYVQFAAGKSHDGFGLGLAIAKRLAELHGGSLTCRSIAGRGSEFVLAFRVEVLPRASVAGAQRAHVQSLSELSTADTELAPATPSRVARSTPATELRAALGIQQARDGSSPASRSLLVRPADTSTPRDGDGLRASMEPLPLNLANAPSESSPSEMMAADRSQSDTASTPSSSVALLRRFTRSDSSGLTSPAAAVRVASSSAQGTAEQEQLGLRVLLAEDSTTIAKLMMSWLKRRGCSVTHVTSGQDAVDAVLHATYPRLPKLPRGTGASPDAVLHVQPSSSSTMPRTEHKQADDHGLEMSQLMQQMSSMAAVARKVNASPFDVILMDQHMPGVVDGIQATRTLRSYGFTMPIYGVTADVFSEVETAFAAAGATRVMTKPVNWQQLYSELAPLRHANAAGPQAIHP